MNVRLLTSAGDISRAAKLVSSQIELVDRNKIGNDRHPHYVQCRSFLMNVLEPRFGPNRAKMLGHTWVGAYQNDVMIGAVHVSGLYEEVSGLVAKWQQNPTNPLVPEQMEALLNCVARVEEIAVLPSSQRSGVGSALLRAAHLELKKHAHPTHSVNSVLTFATNGTDKFFSRNGYTVGSPRMQVPSAYLVKGVSMQWDPTYNNINGVYCYGYLRNLV